MGRKMLRRSRNLVAALGLVLLYPAASAASPFAFATTTSGDLYSVDFGTGSTTLIGDTGQFLESIALSPTGVLYGADTSGRLYTIDTTTGLATLVGSTGLGNIEALDFSGDTLLAVNFDATPTVYSLNTSTAAATSLVTAGSATGLVRAGAVQSPTTMLLRGDTGCAGDCLYSINLTTGTTSLIGSMASPDNIITGLDFLNGSLYATSIGGSLFAVNPATAGLTLISDTGLSFLSLTEGVAQVPVPEPATIALVGAGLAAALRKRRRARRSER